MKQKFVVAFFLIFGLATVGPLSNHAVAQCYNCRAIARTLKAAEHFTQVRFIPPRAEPSVLDAR